MANQLSNRYKLELLKGNLDFDIGIHVFKMALMTTGWDVNTFNKDTHGVWSDVSAGELFTAFGYAGVGDASSNMTVTAITQENGTDVGQVTFSNMQWTATGGSIGPSGGAIIYDSSASNIIVGYIDFNGDQTATDGGTFTVSNIVLKNG